MPIDDSSKLSEGFSVAVANSSRLAWSVARGGLTLGLFVGGAYLIDTRSHVYVGLLLVGWSFARASTYVQRVYRLSLGRAVLDAVSETRVATRIELFLGIDAILGHPAASSTFQRLQRLGRIPAGVTADQWQAELVTRFRTRAGIEPSVSWTRVLFELRAGQLWKNGEYCRFPVLWHEVLIPDESLKSKDMWAPSDDEERRYRGVRVRVVVINGLLKLQLGEWDEEVGHREPGQTHYWTAWDTITTFPLLLNPLDHHLPPRFLLLDYFSFPMHRKSWARTKRTFFREVDEYRRALSTYGEYGEHRLHDRQAEEFKRWLQREGFTRIGGEDSQRTSWSNSFLRIDIDSTQVDSDTYKWLSDEGDRYRGFRG